MLKMMEVLLALLNAVSVMPCTCSVVGSFSDVP